MAKTSDGPLAITVENQNGYERRANKWRYKSMTIIEQIEKENLKGEVPVFAVGDTVRVSVKVIEGAKERIQAFEGVVIAKKNGGIRETFTVRRISYGIGVERTFPVHSPKVAGITVVKSGKVRRAKLYYLRDLTGKAAKVQEIL